jgi:hypothetical protein
MQTDWWRGKLKSLTLLGFLISACCGYGAVDPPERSEARNPTPAWEGILTVRTVDGAVVHQTAPITISIAAEAIVASADCALLVKTTYTAHEKGFIVGPPTPGPIGSCARGLSPSEAAVQAIVRPGASGRLEGESLTIRGDRGVIEAD